MLRKMCSHDLLELASALSLTFVKSVNRGNGVHLECRVVVTSDKSNSVIDTIADHMISFQDMISVANTMQHRDNSTNLLTDKSNLKNGRYVMMTIILINFSIKLINHT